MARKSQKHKQNQDLQKSKPRTAQEPKIPPPLSIATQTLIQRYQSFAGPIPHPDLLLKYNDVIPNGADRILIMAEKQETHRQQMEKKVIEADIWQSRWGLIAGSVLSALAIGGGIYTTALGYTAYGLAAILTPLAGLIGVFVYGQRQRKQERLERSRTRGEHPNPQRK